MEGFNTFGGGLTGSIQALLCQKQKEMYKQQQAQQRQRILGSWHAQRGMLPQNTSSLAFLNQQKAAEMNGARLTPVQPLSSFGALVQQQNQEDDQKRLALLQQQAQWHLWSTSQQQQQLLEAQWRQNQLLQTLPVPALQLPVNLEAVEAEVVPKPPEIFQPTVNLGAVEA